MNRPPPYKHTFHWRGIRRFLGKLWRGSPRTLLAGRRRRCRSSCLIFRGRWGRPKKVQCFWSGVGQGLLSLADATFSSGSFLSGVKPRAPWNELLALFQSLSQSQFLSRGLISWAGQPSRTPLFLTSFLRRWHWSRRLNNSFSLVDNGLRTRLAEHASQLKYSVQPPMPKTLVSVMLRHIIIAYQQTCGISNSCLKSRPQLLRPINRGNIRH
jgi:hypothetical protein